MPWLQDAKSTILRHRPTCCTGELNPRLYNGGRDTLYRIHGTNSTETVGGFETSGCFRLTNADVIELFDKVAVGTKVIVR